MRKIRLDLFICMIIAGVLFAGIWFVGDKIGLFDIVFEGIGTMVDGSQDVPDGEVGGYATEDTPRVSTMQEVVAMARAGKTFTIETSDVKYLNYGVLTGAEYDWRILKLDDGTAIALKLNTKKLQDGEDLGESILPVGMVVMEEPEILDDMVEMLSSSNVTCISDAYIDMDGEAKTTYRNGGMKLVMLIVEIGFMVMPLVLFALYIVVVFWIHSLFVKKGIFPPVFANRNR